MSATVEVVYRFRASCVSCGWSGKKRYWPRDAEDDAFEHNRQKHQPDPVPGDSVEGQQP